MRAGEGETGRRVIKCRVAPRSRGVALLASLGENRLHVVGIGGPLEVFQVTRNASRIRTGEVVVVIDVALHALQRPVRAGQGEACGGVVEGCPIPRRGVVALLAGLREARAHVVGISGALEVFQVAAHASRIRIGEVVVVIDVALRALH